MVGQLFARLADGKLGKEIESNLPRLFSERSARLVNNPESDYSQPREFEHAVSTVSTPDLDFRFVRVRGCISIHVSPSGGGNAWQPLDPSPGQSTFDWPAVDRFLAENWSRILTGAA